MTASSSRDWTPSSRRQPCPICNRTKDSDCRVSSDLAEVICHHPKDLQRGEVVTGADGQRWAFTSNTADDRAGHFVIDKPMDASRPPAPRKVVPLRPRPPAPAPITGPIALARLPEPGRVPPAHWPNGTRLDYSATQWVIVSRKGGEKAHYPHHLLDDKPIPKAGPDPWPLWSEALALEHGPDRWVVEGEGEKVCAWIQAGALVAVSQPGHAHTPAAIQARYSRLRTAGIRGVVYVADHDRTGEEKAARCAAAAAAAGLPFLSLPAAAIWPDLPPGGSIDDAPGTAADRIEALEKAIHAALEEQQQATGTDPLDELLGPVEPGKLRRPRTDKLARALGLILPVRYNLLSNRIEHNGEPIHGDWLSGLYLELAETHGLEVAKDRAADAAIRVARLNAYNPVRQFLDGLSTTLSPEEWAAIDVHCFGGEDPTGWSAIHLQRQLIALVARALEPGCEVHTCLVLQSDQQGIGKSSLWKILGGPWFSDSLGDLRDVREDRLQLHSAWIHEWGEIDNVMGKRESETLKRFLSCSRDDVRRPYGRGTEQLLRSCGLVGTTNRRDFIKDPTGNRRFPIIEVSRVDLEWVKANRDRIWGSALAAYRAGQPWHYSADEGRLVSQQAMDYAAIDPLRDLIETWAEDHPDADEVPIARILWDLRHECPEHWGKRRDREFVRQVSLALSSIGWKAMSTRIRYPMPDGSRTDKVTPWKRP